VADRETELIEALCRERDRANRNYRLNEAYYEGQNRLRSRGLAIPPQMEQLALVVNWARVVVHELDNRLDLRGFRIASDPELEARLWGWWKSADMEDETSPAHVEALVQGRAYIVVGPHPDDPSVPIWTVETGRCMHASIDPVTRDPVAAVRVYDYDDRGVPQRAALYLPYETRYYGRSDRSGGTWLRDSVYRHGVPSPLVAPMINRARVADRYGRSEMDDIKPLMDAACRTLMNLAGAQELMAVPQRWALGVSAEDFLDSEGNPIPVWEAYLGRIWALENENAKVGQFTAADLRNFTTVVEHYMRQATVVSGLPAHYFGFTTENPASAEAIASSESRLVKNAERKQALFGGAWRRAARLAVKLMTGRDAPDLEVLWRNAATPTLAAQTDAVVKLKSAGLIPTQAAWELMEFSPDQQTRYADMLDLEASSRLARLLSAPPVEPGDASPVSDDEAE